MESQYWDPRIETLPRRELEELQLRRLRHVVRRCYDRIPFYRRKMREAGISPDDIRSLDDIEKLPFTTKQDLRDSYPFGFLAVPREEVVEIHASSGTTGKPTVVAYTKRDIENWADMVARCMYMAGVRKNDVFQNISGYGLFTGGLGFHYGAERIGCMIVPAGTGGTRRQIMLMKDLGTTVIHAMPSYALYMAEVAKNEMGIDPDRDLSLRIGFFGAEMWSESMRAKLEEELGLEAFDSYGLSEMNGPGVAFECPEHDGLHIWEDHFLVEVIDPETLEPVGEGERGELVLTSLTKDAMPLIRYRTRDLTMLLGVDCACGRTHARISRIIGRTDDMIVVRGVNVFPSQIEEIVMRHPEVKNYLIVVDKVGYMDRMRVQVEVTDELMSGEAESLLSFKKKLEDELKDLVGIRIEVEPVERGTIPRSEGKAKRVLDLRKEVV